VRPAAHPSTLWFGRAKSGYVLTPTRPARVGAPPDYDQDGRAGRTLAQTDEGLEATAATQRLVLTLAVTRSLRLDGEPTVVLWSRLVAARGNARVLARLEDCTAKGACRTLSEGRVVDGTWSRGTTFISHDMTMPAVTTTVVKGHRLRLTLVLSDAGSRSDLLVGFGSRSTPSRIVLPLR
jgi:predicted acyl esterase